MSKYDFILKRLHSLSGIFPMGVFLFFHYFINSYATEGGTAFNKAAGFLQHLPYLPAIEITLLGIPILYHAIYGLIIIYTGSSNLASYGYYRNWMYFIQRVTGVIAIIYIFVHVYTTRISSALIGAKVDYRWMAEALKDPNIFYLNVIGLIATVFHFTNGIWGFLITWGITVGEKAQKVSGIICILLFLIMSILGIQIFSAYKI